MNTTNPKPLRYSADVRMHLTVNGQRLRIGQLAPDFIILDDVVDHPPGPGEITMSIDGEAESWPIMLPDGISVEKSKTRTAPFTVVRRPAISKPNVPCPAESCER
jgi:hypothetical protein